MAPETTGGGIPTSERTMPEDRAPAIIPASVGLETAGVPERPIPPIPERIMGKGIMDSEELASFLLSFNPLAGQDFVEDLSRCYVEEAEIEGVNHDLAFSQMCLETGFLHYGNLVTPDMNNFCGLGAISSEQRGEAFPDPRTGVRAHIQHLKAYATDEPLKQALVDPRYRWVKYGRAPTLDGLSGTWASDREYAQKIKSILQRLYSFRSGGQ
jgi:hypothetical protein